MFILHRLYHVITQFPNGKGGRFQLLCIFAHIDFVSLISFETRSACDLMKHDLIYSVTT